MSSDNQAIAEQLRFARAYAAEQLPWFAPALFRCRIILTAEVGVAAVDRHYNVYWNPGVVSAIYAQPSRAEALAELGFLWVHEISHRLRQHGERAADLGVSDGASSRWWNVACDLEINDAEWRGLRMPAAYPGQRAAAYGYAEGLLAERYYQLLRDAEAEGGNALDEGSGVHGRPRPWETGDRQQLTALDEEIIRREVARQTREADADAVPDAWKAWAADVLRSRVNWRQRLGHRLSIAVQRGRGMRTDYRYGRPNRRQAVYDPLLPPTLGGDRTARVAIVVDTSASMGTPELQRALAEVAAVVRQLDAPVTIIPCDVQAYAAVRVVSEREAFQIDYLPGGSGTDMRAGLEAASRLRPVPDTVLLLTDGITEYPDRPYPLPLLIGLLGDDADRRPPPQPPFRADQIIRIQ